MSYCSSFSCIFFSPAHAAPFNLENKVIAKLLHFSIMLIFKCYGHGETNYIRYLKIYNHEKVNSIHTNLDYIFAIINTGWFLFTSHKIIYSGKYCSLNHRNHCLIKYTMNTIWRQTHFWFFFFLSFLLFLF